MERLNTFGDVAQDLIILTKDYDSKDGVITSIPLFEMAFKRKCLLHWNIHSALVQILFPVGA